MRGISLVKGKSIGEVVINFGQAVGLAVPAISALKSLDLGNDISLGVLGE